MPIMKLLFLGGTTFLGRTLVEEALAAGHEVTLFNRGQTNPELFPDVEKIRGDRSVDLSPLQGRRWDAAIDTSGFQPRIVRMASQARYTWRVGLSPEREAELLEALTTVPQDRLSLSR